MTTRIDSAAVRRSFSGLALAGLLALGASVAMPLASLAQDDGQVTVSTATGDLGTYLVGPDGRTLYYFTKDVTPGQSACAGDCLKAWPPLLASADAATGRGRGRHGHARGRAPGRRLAPGHLPRAAALLLAG